MQYKFDFGLSPSIAYVQSKAKGIKGMDDTECTKYMELGANYYFNKNISVYADYQLNQLEATNPLNQNIGNTLAIGLVYKF